MDEGDASKYRPRMVPRKTHIAATCVMLLVQYLYMRHAVVTSGKEGSPVVENCETSYASMAADRNPAKFAWPSKDDHPAMAYLHDYQHPADCSDKHFLVYPFPKKEDTRNLGAIFMRMIPWMAYAHMTNRILVADDVDWNTALCDSHDIECYFEPISSCTYKKDVAHLPENEFFQLMDHNHPKEHAGMNSKKVWIVTETWYRPAIEDQEYVFPGGHISKCLFQEACLLFFLRTKPWIHPIIDKALSDSLDSDYDPARTIGLPIRGSDHCNGHTAADSSPGEYDCSLYTPEKFFERAAQIKRFDPTVTSLLITSEDPTMVAKCKELAKGTDWKLVFNKGDLMQGTGSATGLVSNNAKGMSVAEVLASAISTIHIQLRTRYLIGTYKSSYGIMMMILHRADAVTFTENRMMFPSDPREFIKPMFLCP